MTTFPRLDGFDELLPDAILNAAEEALQRPFSGVVLPLPSYINRVYELEDREGDRWILKFYRPGRWSRGALLEEHLFTLDCRSDDIPVVVPLRFPGGGTLRTTPGGIFFAAFPKRWGRPLECTTPEDWRRLGRLLARLHLTGSRREAHHRLCLDPWLTTVPEVERLLDSGLIGRSVSGHFEAAAKALAELVMERYTPPPELLRLHGDCHCGNILQRPDEGLMLIDFDDMAMGPAAQDLWLLLPGRLEQCRAEWTELIGGYRELRDFPGREEHRIELLRAMRMLYFLDWCARQSGDFNFADRYPDWGSDLFWRRETAALQDQYRAIQAD